MSTMFADTLLIVFISVCTALLAEGECGCFPDVRAVPWEKDSRPGVPRATSLACLRAHLLYSGVGGVLGRLVGRSGRDRVDSVTQVPLVWSRFISFAYLRRHLHSTAQLLWSESLLS